MLIARVELLYSNQVIGFTDIESVQIESICWREILTRPGFYNCYCSVFTPSFDKTGKIITKEVIYLYQDIQKRNPLMININDLR